MECGGYKKDFKWRPFEETNIKLNLERSKRSTVHKGGRQYGIDDVVVSPPTTAQGSANSSKPTTPLNENGPRLGDPPAQEGANHRRKDSKRASAAVDDMVVARLPQRPAKAKRKERQPSGQSNGTTSPSDRPADPLSTANRTSPGRITSPNESEEGGGGVPLMLTTSAEQTLPYHFLRRRSHSPTFTELFHQFGNVIGNDADYINFTLPVGMNFPLTPSGIHPPLLSELGENREAQHNDGFNAAALPHFSSPKSRATSPATGSSVSPRASRHAWQGPVHYLYSQPYFAQDSPEMLAFRYDRLTCGILSIMDGPNENPWRTLIWPLAQHSPALYNALLAMTAYHSSTDVPALRLVGHERKQSSIQYIAEGIRERSMTDQTAIATALALGFCESWDQHTASGNTHIKGAQALVKRTMEKHQQNPVAETDLARLKFLCNAWVFMDVIARLTAVDSDESNDFDNTFIFASENPNIVMGDDEDSGFGIDFGMPIDARLDPLMGCANTLFPLIGRVANLVRKVCRSQNNSPAVISQANDLKLGLETWDPPAYIEEPKDPTTEVQHTLQTAEAYRWATLLHLHQAVPELPSDSSRDLSQRVLQYLATVPLASRTVVVHIYPLMVAGCEASNEEDRQWVRDRWAAMGQRMRIGVIEKCATVTEEVWRRRDAYEAQPTTRRKLVATAELNPSRQRGQPPVRTDTGFQSSDPGRTGMVFSYVEVDGEQQSGSGADRRPPRPGSRHNRGMSHMDAAYTVRGHLHWVGVMWDWGWEGESAVYLALCYTGWTLMLLQYCSAR